MNGWTNYETWNVALWIDNDESLHHIAKSSLNYNDFVNSLDGIIDQTPDGVSFFDSRLDMHELDSLIFGLKNEVKDVSCQ